MKAAAGSSLQQPSVYNHHHQQKASVAAEQHQQNVIKFNRTLIKKTILAKHSQFQVEIPTTLISCFFFAGFLDKKLVINHKLQTNRNKASLYSIQFSRSKTKIQSVYMEFHRNLDYIQFFAKEILPRKTMQNSSFNLGFLNSV